MNFLIYYRDLNSFFVKIYIAFRSKIFIQKILNFHEKKAPLQRYLKTYVNKTLMKKRYFSIALLIFIWLLPQMLAAQKHTYLKYTVGFYNLENMFDTINDPNKNDEEFLPNGSYKWGTVKYTNKLHNMSYAISTFADGLAFMGVAEAENINVLKDIVAQPALEPYHLKPILIEGPDKRGIDVGFIYNPELFTVTHVTSTRIKSKIPNFYTRDQLCVTGFLAGEEVNVIVVHWPSRGGGVKYSAPRRRDAALTTKAICDSLFNINPNARIIIMGDLNDDPTDKSVTKYLGAIGNQEKVKQEGIYNPCIELYKKGIGSLGYRDEWNLFDQIMVSYPFIDKNYKTLQFYKSRIDNADFLTQQTGQYKGYPLRTHAGGVWTNGYSDHFPSLMYLIKEVK